MRCSDYVFGPLGDAIAVWVVVVACVLLHRRFAVTCEPRYHDCMTASCEVCEEIMVWIECPTGGWWRHVDHPADDHDGEAPVPDHIDGSEGA